MTNGDDAVYRKPNAGMTTCERGHRYPEQAGECPFCEEHDASALDVEGNERIVEARADEMVEGDQ